ncbi:hypothetical protein ACXYN8_03620 [Altererythrobacter sp. CAU 1778]
MSEAATAQIPQGPFVLSGPVARAEACQLPIRGDLAHIGLAGRYFVPHYIVPERYVVGSGGAELRTRSKGHGDMIAMLEADQAFEVLDIAEGWAWGCCSIKGPSGYVPLSAIERAEA